jgi:hypothetical protein
MAHRRGQGPTEGEAYLRSHSWEGVDKKAPKLGLELPFPGAWEEGREEVWRLQGALCHHSDPSLGLPSQPSVAKAWGSGLAGNWVCSEAVVQASCSGH